VRSGGTRLITYWLVLIIIIIIIIYTFLSHYKIVILEAVAAQIR